MMMNEGAKGAQENAPSDDLALTPDPGPGEAAAAPDAPADSAVTGFAAAMDQATDVIGAGGPVAALLMAMSVFATAIILAKLWQFARVNVGARRGARKALRLYRAGDVAGALAAASRPPSPAGEAIARAVRGVGRGLPEAKVREEVLRYGGDVLERLRGGFRALEATASLAPLLGLFGTVLGMIEAFRQLEAAGDQVNPAILSGGIWQALLTTAIGLAVAIPVVAVLNWLEGRVDRLAHDMDSLVTQFFTEDLSQDAEDTADDKRRRMAVAAE